MERQVVILCVEDEAEVREALLRDLQPFSAVFRIEAAVDADEAREVVESLDGEKADLGLVLCDHRLPGTTGVDFLVDLNGRKGAREARKVLVTGQAGLEDTVRAVNEAGLDHYIAKPWTPEALQAVVRNELTIFVLAGERDLKPFLPVLDAPRILEAIAQRASDQ